MTEGLKKTENSLLFANETLCCNIFMTKRNGPDLKTTLGSLLRTTFEQASEQASVVREVVTQQAIGKGGIIDQALTQRKRTALMAKLGEEVVRTMKTGALSELALHPELGAILQEIEEIDTIGNANDSFEDIGSMRSEAVSARDFQPPAPGQETSVWRPVVPEDATFLEDEPVSSSAKKSSGLTFGVQEENDDDLDAYMHEDDVPND